MIKVNENINADELLELLKKAELENQRIIFERDGQAKLALINYADLKLLEDLEDARDCELLRQAIEESKGQPSITFNELLDELGLTIESLTGDKNE
jgi:hypothetical protein